MTDKQKYAIKLAINTMDKYFGKHYNTAYCNRETGVSVGYGEAINILSDMLSNADVHTCNCQHNSNSRDSESCCRCDSKQTNADRIRNMSDYDLGDLLQSVSSSVENGNAFISFCIDDTEITMDFRDIYEWLQSEAEQSRRKEDE